LSLSVPLARFTSLVGCGSAFIVRQQAHTFMSLTAITAMLPAVNQAVKTATGILHLVKDTETKQKVIELQTAILDLHDRVRLAQSEQDELAKVKDELERKLMEYERWDAQAARYELRELADGIFVYALKPEHKGSEPLHYLCPHCFNQKKRSILQRPRAGHKNYVCHDCKMDISPVKSEPFYGIATTPRRRSRYDGLIG